MLRNIRGILGLPFVFAGAVLIAVGLWLLDERDRASKPLQTLQP